MWHVSKFIPIEQKVLHNSLLFLFLGLRRSIKNGVLTTSHPPLFRLLCFWIHRLEASCRGILQCQLHSGSVFLSLSFFFQRLSCVRSSPIEFLTKMQNFGRCSYTVIISTSCSSPRYTRDQISLCFGDGYGNQVRFSYAYTGIF